MIQRSYIDSHCHLHDPSFGKLDDYFFEWNHYGIGEFVIPATETACFRSLAKLRNQHPQLFIGFGIHPLYAKDHEDSALRELEKLVTECRPHFIGEIGLDFHDKGLDAEWMETMFKEQVGIAKRAKLPIMLHVRKAHQQVLKFLKATHFTEGGIVHAYSGSLAEAKEYISQGFALGIGPSILKKNSKLPAIISHIGTAHITIETDSPHMSPNPQTLLNIVAKVEEIQNMKGDELKEQLYQTTHRALRLDS